MKGKISAAAFVAEPRAAGAGEPTQDHDHQIVPSDLTLRVKAIESLLIDKGLVDRAALDVIVDTFETKIGPRNGARIVARAWVDPAYKARLLSNATTAIAETFAPAGSTLIAVAGGVAITRFWI